jgi:uncharacterized membrane protein YfcA
MEYIGYFTSILIGVALGLIGGGSCILTLPVLVYLFAIEPVLATTYSLFIVGFASAENPVGYFKKGLVNIKTAFFLAFRQSLQFLPRELSLYLQSQKKCFPLENL